MIDALPRVVYFITGAGEVMTEISLGRRVLVLRVFETAAEAARAATVAASFQGGASVSSASLKDVLKGAQTHQQPVEVVFSRYDGLGQLVDVEVVRDPFAHVH